MVYHPTIGIIRRLTLLVVSTLLLLSLLHNSIISNSSDGANLFHNVEAFTLSKQHHKNYQPITRWGIDSVIAIQRQQSTKNKNVVLYVSQQTRIENVLSVM